MQFTEAQDRRQQDATSQTAVHLRSIAQSTAVRDLTQLSLPEIDQVVEQVAQVVPAGNLPGMILSGLARLPGRKLPANILHRDVNLLFRAASRTADRLVYGAFFAGPAAILWGYQNLLKLAGKDPEQAFPEGTWQFYVDYALRDDTARHTNETHGFDTALIRHQINLSPADRITAWAMTAIHCLRQYPALLENEWRERVYTSLLKEITSQQTDAAHYANLYRRWELQRPYRRGQDAGSLTYAEYRRMKFNRFLEEATQALSSEARYDWLERIYALQEHDLPAYQRQMSILAYLEPGPFGETRTPYSWEQAKIGLIHNGRYYLIPVCVPGSQQPVEVDTLREQVAAILVALLEIPAYPLQPLARLKRSALAELQNTWSGNLARDRAALREAAILINNDPVSPPSIGAHPSIHTPLSELRQAERGLGDHPLTIFDTGRTFIFDQSHIFFDGTWGAALAEILTNEALSWAAYLSQRPPVVPGDPPVALDLRLTPQEIHAVERAPQVSIEVGAENERVNVKAILALRKLFKRRNDLIQLTVNDILILYRAIHAHTYRPSTDLLDSLQDLAEIPEARQAALAALEAIGASRAANPAILIPVDASRRMPRDRLYPMTFEVPIVELDLLALHGGALQALDAYRRASSQRDAAYAEFDQLQRQYLATLAGFGNVLSKAKEIALSGESAGTSTIKLLAHLPTPLQRMLEAVPGKIDLLNDLIKGREVFSNIGAVAPGSTLVRFTTAKDDNEKKTLAWGVLTDAKGIMHLSLRDFRPHVRLLDEAGQRHVAVQMAQEYLDVYAQGLNEFVSDLHRITVFSRETRFQDTKYEH